jgi:hypothetical protein
MELNKMNRIKIIGISAVSVVVIILASISNVVGYQTVQSTIQNKINKEVNQREFLFQTIVDIANNKEIQQIILKSKINREGLLYPDEKFPTSNTPILTKNQIKQMYFIGLVLTKFISKSKMHSILDQYQFSNQEMQKALSAVIKKDATLDREVTQLSNSECDCDNEQTSSLGPLWHFPVLCTIILTIAIAYHYLILYPICPILDLLGFDLLNAALAFIEMILIYFLPAIIGCWWFIPD